MKRPLRNQVNVPFGALGASILSEIKEASTFSFRDTQVRPGELVDACFLPVGSLVLD